MRRFGEFFIQFMESKYHKYRIYAHNLSNFDSVFILTSLIKLSERFNIKIEPLFRDQKLIQIKIFYGWREDYKKYRYYIIIQDSLLILLSYLDKLSKTFLSDSPELMKMENREIIDSLLSNHRREVLLRSNINETLDPHKVTIFLNQISEYCIRDCVALSHIIYRFGIMIAEKYGVNIHDYPTLSSLALAIYQTNYLPIDNEIPLISGGVYRDIRKSYHGGHTDVYKLYSDREVYSYDFTSMYPYIKATEEMPVGNPKYFKGNILHFNETFESLNSQHCFCKCNIFVDESLQKPLYLTSVKIDGIVRNVCATGTFLNQWVYLPEISYYYKITNGKIRILENSIQEGYLFESKNIFKPYIESLFQIKQSSSKSNPWYLISKILMNSLYGRFGLKQEITEHLFIGNQELEDLDQSIKIQDITNIEGSGLSVLTTHNDSDEVKLKSSIPIAAAITARARMLLHSILNDQDLDILYIDTDSFKCHQKITDLSKYQYLNHENLGGLKYEYTLNESIFLAPKVYGGIYRNGDELTKVKGFKNKIEFEQMKELLFTNKSLNLTQDTWYRNWLRSEIKIMKTPYLVNINENKRLIVLLTFTTKPLHFYKYDSESKENL